LKDVSATRTPAVSPITRGPDAWFVGAFLVLFGAAIAAAMPAIAGAVRTAVADGVHGKTDTAQRVVVRARFTAVRLVEPKAPSSHDLLEPPEVVAPTVPGAVSLSSYPQDTRARVLERGYHARAPPPL